MIVYEGEPVRHGYILEQGLALAVKEGDGCPSRSFSFGDMFGDAGIGTGDHSLVSVLAKASKRGTCRCLRVSETTFLKFGGFCNNFEELLYQRRLQERVYEKPCSGEAVPTHQELDSTPEQPDETGEEGGGAATPTSRAEGGDFEMRRKAAYVLNPICFVYTCR